MCEMMFVFDLPLSLTLNVSDFCIDGNVSLCQSSKRSECVTPLVLGKEFVERYQQEFRHIAILSSIS
jgi:hypothetical protein